MNNTYKRNREYIAPLIERIQLDNVISLVLLSAAPIGPGETMNNIPGYVNNDPFKTNLS